MKMTIRHLGMWIVLATGSIGLVGCGCESKSSVKEPNPDISSMSNKEDRINAIEKVRKKFE